MADGGAGVASNVSTQTYQVLPSPLERPRLASLEKTGSNGSSARHPTYFVLREGSDKTERKSLGGNGDHSAAKLPNVQELKTIYPDTAISTSKSEIVQMISPLLKDWNHTSGPQSKLTTWSQETTINTRSSRNQSPQGKSLPRQDSSYYLTQDVSDASSELNADTQARQVRARERLEILRGRVLRTRRAIKDRRSKLKQLRENVLDAGDKLTRKIEEIIALQTVNALETISPYYERLRQAQDDLGPEEDEFERLERRIEDQEQDLEQEEDHFYRHNEVPEGGISESKLDDVISPLIKPYPPPETEPEPEPLSLENDLVQRYLGRVAEAELLKDELDELDDEYDRLSHETSFRKRHNVRITDETTSFLTEYPELRAATLENLRAVEEHLFDLRDQCLDQKLFTDADYIYEIRDALVEEVMESVEEARDRSPLRVAAYHIDYREEDIDFDDRRDYVNKWLLKWVEESAFETFMLRRFIFESYPNKDKELTDEVWSTLALENWDSDAAGILETRNFYAGQLNTIMTKVNGPSTGRRTGFFGGSSEHDSLEVDLDDYGVHEEAIVGSEAGSYTTQILALANTPLKRRSSSAPPTPRRSD